jgi:copper chaperone CopZ
MQIEEISYCGDGAASGDEECDTDVACKNGFQCSSNCTCVPEEREITKVLSSINSTLAKGEKATLGGFEVQVTDVSPASAMIHVFEDGNDVSGLQFLTTGQSWRKSSFIATLDGVNSNKANVRISLVEEPASKPFNAKITSPANASIEARMIFEITGISQAQGGVQAVEVSFDSGRSWKKALGASAWVYRGFSSESGWRNLSVRVTSFSNEVSPAFGSTQVFFSSCKRLLGNAPQENAIDIVVVPSKFVSLFGFKENIDDAANELFSQPVFASNPGLKDKMNFYYYAANVNCEIAGTEPPSNRMWKCDLPDNFFAACSFADVSAVLVNSTTYGGTSGNPFIQTAGKPRVFVHEAGHAIFNLADRYCCDGAYWEESPYQNLWRSSAVCSLQTSIETGGGACRSIGSTGWNEMNTESVMQKIEFDFDQREEQRIKWVLDNYGK